MGGWVGGCPGGILCVLAPSHRTTGRHIPRAGEGAEKVATEDRSNADVGFCGPTDATCGGQDARVYIENRLNFWQEIYESQL